jgi:hypothetical protein
MSSTLFEHEDHLQEDGCICIYGMVCYTCIGINSLVGRKVCSMQPTALLIPMHVKRTIS